MMFSVVQSFLFYLCTSQVAQVYAQSVYIATTVTLPPVQPTNEPTYVDDTSFQNAVLNSTNYFRGQHNASPLSYNSTLADFASNYVDECRFEHTGGPYGENLAQGYADVSRSIDAWGNERDMYDFAAGQFSEATGHFTQLVWRASTTVGCGRRFCNGQNDVSGWYLVCEYYPRGNIIGAFVENVLPQGSTGSPTLAMPSATASGQPGATTSSGASALAISLGWPAVLLACLLCM